VLFHAPLIAPQLRRHSSGVLRGIGEIVDGKGAFRDLDDRSRRSPGYPEIATLSYRDVKDLLAECGLDISYETITGMLLPIRSKFPSLV
jgi:hypothetical protein